MSDKDAILEDMSRASLTIRYDGSALKDHTIDVRELAPALLAVGELFDSANSVLNGDAAEVSVHVRAHEAGCFSIDLEVIQSIVKRGIALLSGQEFSAAANLKELIFGAVGVGYSLVKLIKWLRGKKPDKIEKLPAGMVRVTLDGESMDIPFRLLRLYQDIAVRSSLERIVKKPLENPGISEVFFKDKRHILIDVAKTEAPFFETPELEDRELTDGTVRSAYSIVSLAFKDENKWRLHDGSNQISVLIDDKDFLWKVDSNNISFSKGDVLICDVRVVQKQTKTGLKTEYTVEKVIEHIPALRQLRLEIDDTNP